MLLLAQEGSFTAKFARYITSLCEESSQPEKYVKQLDFWPEQTQVSGLEAAHNKICDSLQHDLAYSSGETVEGGPLQSDTQLPSNSEQPVQTKPEYPYLPNVSKVRTTKTEKLSKLNSIRPPSAKWFKHWFSARGFVSKSS